MTVFRTMCPMNCHPTLCGMLVDVEDGRVVGVRGDPDNPDSQGFLCVRGQASREIIGNPPRLLHPLIRVARGREEWRAGVVGRGARPDRGAHARGRPRGGRHLVGPRRVRQQLRHARGLAPDAPLRQPLRLPVVEPHDDLLGAGRLRPRRSPASLETNTKEDMGAHAADRPVGRQPRQPAQHRPATWWRRAGAAPTWSPSTCARPRPPAQSDESAGGPPRHRRRAGAGA